LDESSPDPTVTNMINTYLETARLIKQRTDELHLALTRATPDSELYPKTYSTLYQRSMYQSMRNVSDQVLRLLDARLPTLPAPARATATRLFERRDVVTKLFETFLKQRVLSRRIRYHSDLHLSRFLYTGKDFIVI